MLSARQTAILRNVENEEAIHPKFFPLDVKERAFIQSTNRESFKEPFFQQILLHMEKEKNFSSGEDSVGTVGEKDSDLASFYRDTDVHRILSSKTKKELLHDALDLGVEVNSAHKKSDIIDHIVASLLE